METVQGYIARLSASDQGTKGLLVLPGFYCRTLELPWRDNAQRISCIPAGTYTLHFAPSRLGKVYRFDSVPGRSGVLIHWGNLAGDVSKGWKSHVEGCVILGAWEGKIGGQEALMLSQPTIRAFHSYMQGRPLELEIKEIGS